MSLFNDFNGIDDFDKKIDFYHHAQHWSNRMILGDSLLVMTCLAEKERLKEKVQTIYFDPPYGIKFGSNWQVSTRKRDVKDGKIEDATRQRGRSGHFGIREGSEFIRILRILETDWSLLVSYSLKRGQSSCGSEMITSTSCALPWTKCSGTGVAFQ